MKKTKKAYEKRLNELYADAYSLSEATENFEYLTYKSRAKSTTSMQKIHTAYNNHTLGSLLRKYDPIAFNTGYNMWCIPSALEIK